MSKPEIQCVCGWVGGRAGVGVVCMQACLIGCVGSVIKTCGPVAKPDLLVAA